MFGVLINNQWSVTGWGKKDVNQMLLQPFLNYHIADGWYLTSSPLMTANWKADRGNQWTAPVGAGVGKLFKLGKPPINTSLHMHYNAERRNLDKI